ncbi:unnamed protein product [Arctia plantaginis]|uniref:Lebercilin domain-containing protein n=1 Tax=Arctia plantaginis TaxID=874455 RepID=A0A8S1ACW8_ARCPL|nr:unnamed protein product [Arctia plantaginis]
MSVLSLKPEDNRKDQRKESLESVYSSNSRLNLLSKRKRMNPLGMDLSNPSLARKGGDRYVTQRELSNENKILRAVQKKQEIALQRYENSNAELPQVLHSHTEEVRIQQMKYKQLKQQNKEVIQKLKERDMQLQQLRDEHNHLLELSKDRNLQDREKLQAQLTELSSKVQQQNETIMMLQRRIALEAKNFKHQLQNEINKHKDTRHDLDMAINNADKLTTIIEMKEKMLSTAASRSVKSPVKTSSSSTLPVTKQQYSYKTSRSETDATVSATKRDDRVNLDQNIIAKLCENSRNVSSALSHEEDTSSSTEPRSRYGRSRTNSTSTRSTSNTGTRKNSKSSDEMVDLAKTVQDGMADLAIFDDELVIEQQDEIHKKIEGLKTELMKRIKNDEPPSRKTSALRRKTPEESIEEQPEYEIHERPKSRGRRNSSVSFYEESSIAESTTTVAVHEKEKQICVKRENSSIGERSVKREGSALSERMIDGKPIDKYCKDIMQDIEKSTKVIDKHMKAFGQPRFESDKLVEQLEVVDKINEFVNGSGDIPEAALSELNNNFKMLTENVLSEAPLARKRSIASRRNSRDARTNLLADSMTNQEMLEDLLGRK